MSTTGHGAPQGPVPSRATGSNNEPDGLNGSNGVDDQQVPDAAAHPQEPGGPQGNGVDGGPHKTSTRHSSVPVKDKLKEQRDKIKEQKDKVKTKANPPGGFDSTPIPDAPPGYTVKFVFHEATNLPVADISTGSSDPFLEATLYTSLPKRHKEDADLGHRTPTIARTTEPKWEAEWIVANVPSSGFKLKCRLYDEDWPDHNDRLGNVTINVPHVDETWPGFSRQEFHAKKRVGSKRAYFLKAVTTAFQKDSSMTPSLFVSATVLGKSNSEPNGQIYTLGPTSYYRHVSPMIGRLAGVQVNKNEDHDSGHHEAGASAGQDSESRENKTKRYDFQAVELQLQGPVPPKLYHRYVEFRPLIGLMFSRKGLRGRVLHKALTHQHNRIYNFDSSTQYGTFKPCSEEASLQFLKLVHFDQGGRLFTYIITLDGLFRFTETGKEFGIDLLSKHTMHSDVATYIACSGEFFVRRLQKPTGSTDPEPDQPTHPSQEIPGGPPFQDPPTKPEYYQLVIDNDSGTYRPDKSVLPDLQKFLERQFPGLGVVALACDDDEDQKLKEAQRNIKKKEGEQIRMVRNRSPSASSFSSDDISDLEEMDSAGDAGRKSKKEQLKNQFRPKAGESAAGGSNQVS
ncbi:C2 domain-containing protein [Truncatella angustata]|uniref:C2 domain-containing protein n=1 Tax=Truncatella angustata TaxID=152316 RepID=A0A9P9A404_9PEZI|nr:C2 domain-containing protein [Truncatella angustata]KAH6660663.1 C2 domain-containing protein [Truncatella angustata]